MGGESKEDQTINYVVVAGTYKQAAFHVEDMMEYYGLEPLRKLGPVHYEGKGWRLLYISEPYLMRGLGNVTLLSASFRKDFEEFEKMAYIINRGVYRDGRPQNNPISK